MKGRDVAFFISLQGILLGSAFLLSSGESDTQNRPTTGQQQVEVQSWINDHGAAQAVARQMNMPNPVSLEQGNDSDSVAVALQRTRQQRSWVF